jgi:RNA polymerase sigma-70 factor (ECF subfamily)
MSRPPPAPALDPANWVGEHGDYLYRFAWSRVRDRDAAEEVVQEALLAALAARHRFRGRSSERSWLTAILKRKVADWLRAEVRRRAREGPKTDRWADGLFTRSGKWKARPGDWSADDPGREMTRAAFWEALAGCLDKLPPRLRRAFVLRHVEDRPAAEVRPAVGATEANLWVMLHRARLRLWRCLGASWFGDDPAGGGR